MASDPSNPPAGRGSTSPETSAADDALDVLGSLLQTLGRVSFAMDEDGTEAIKASFERWAQHVLVGTPVLDTGGKPSASGKRDWGGLKRFVVGHRQRETSYVVKSIDDFRSALFTFTTAFSRVVGEDGRADVSVREQLARLEEATRTQDAAWIAREARATVSVVGESVDRRVERHRAQIVELASHVRQLSNQLQMAKKAGETDGLTQVPNRACFDEFIARTVDLAAFTANDVYLLMIDVDRFKQTNDALGHGAGDAALKAVADRLIRTFPRRGDLVARYGGDEFAVVVRDVRADEARMLAERLVVAMRTTTAEYLGKAIPLSISVGMAARRDGDTTQTWLARADAALYHAKEEGRDRWVEGVE